MDFRVLECRIEPIKQTFYQIEELGNNCVKTKKKKIYDYYICDYCKEKIIITKKITDRMGGIMHVPINSYKDLKLAVCNKCAKPVIKELNDYYNKNF